MLVPKSYGVTPPGGYVFVDTTASPPKNFVSDSWNSVATLVLKDRLANGRPPGNPGGEVVDAMCAAYPSFCREVDPSKMVPLAPRPGGASLSARVASWIGGFQLVAARDPGVGQGEATRRSNICVACPHNKEFREGCGSCIASIERVTFVWRRDRIIPNEKSLLACNIDGQHNPSAVLTQAIPGVDPETNHRLPSQCWRKRG